MPEINPLNLNPTSAEETLAVIASEPVDWVQVRLWSNLSPENRVKTAMNALIFARAALRSTLKERFPEQSLSEINMKILNNFTQLRMIENV